MKIFIFATICSKIHNEIIDMKKSDIFSEILKNTYNEDIQTCIKCADALKIARKFKINPIEIIEILNDKKIKIRQCQLGCFR